MINVQCDKVWVTQCRKNKLRIISFLVLQDVRNVKFGSICNHHNWLWMIFKLYPNIYWKPFRHCLVSWYTNIWTCILLKEGIWFLCLEFSFPDKCMAFSLNSFMSLSYHYLQLHSLCPACPEALFTEITLWMMLSEAVWCCNSYIIYIDMKASYERDLPKVLFKTESLLSNIPFPLPFLGQIFIVHTTYFL